MGCVKPFVAVIFLFFVMNFLAATGARFRNPLGRAFLSRINKLGGAFTALVAFS